jgi:hypothetical protein
MSQNVTLSGMISPAQSLAITALVSGWSITKAAKETGVARETVSRWVHHDPVFIAQFQEVRAELAIQARCALEALGMKAVGVLHDAIANQFQKPWRLKAACSVLKMISADRAETTPPLTALEVQVRLLEREAELRKRLGKLDATDVSIDGSVNFAQDCAATHAPPSAVPTAEERPAAGEPANGKAADGKVEGAGERRGETLNEFRRTIADWVD